MVSTLSAAVDHTRGYPYPLHILCISFAFSFASARMQPHGVWIGPGTWLAFDAVCPISRCHPLLLP